jgi:hypothetical protein
MGQTGRNFSKRYKEHLRALTKNCNSLKFSQYLNEYMYNFGSIENVMKILIIQKKVALQLKILNYPKKGNLVPEKFKLFKKR